MNMDSFDDDVEHNMLDTSAVDPDFINRSESEDEQELEDKKVIKTLSYIKLTVDPESGAHKTIEEAIALVPSEQSTPTTIKISSGLYKENLKIVNKSLILKCKDSNSEVYISGEEGPTILIDNDPSHIVELHGLKVSFKGKLPNHGMIY